MFSEVMNKVILILLKTLWKGQTLFSTYPETSQKTIETKIRETWVRKVKAPSEELQKARFIWVSSTFFLI